MATPYMAGVVAATLLALVAAGAAGLIEGLPAAPLVLLGGVGAATAAGTHSEAFGPGARWSASWLLRAGVALLGAQLSLAAIVEYGIASIALVAISIGAVFLVIALVGRWWGIPSTLWVLMAAGIAICGNSAIAAIAPLVRAERAHVAVAVAIITVSGMLSVVAYPVIGGLLQLSQIEFGLWSGVAIADTGQVLAAALAYGPEATDAATVTKLTRNAFIGPVTVLVAMAWAPCGEGIATPRRLRATTALPPFVVAFLVLAVLRSVGVIHEEVAALLGSAGSFTILIGLAGIGLSTRVGSLVSAGPRPLVLGALVITTLSSVVLVLVLTVQ